MANGTLKVSNIETSSGSGTITLGASGETVDLSNGTITLNSSMKNTPSFFASNSGANQDITDDTTTKVTLGNELYDTNSAFADSKFTVPSGEAGKYCFVYSVDCHSLAVSNMNYAYAYIYKNGSSVSETAADFRSNPTRRFAVTNSIILDLSAGDYIELYVNIDDTSGNPRVIGDSGFSTYLGASKIIGV